MGLFPSRLRRSHVLGTSDVRPSLDQAHRLALPVPIARVASTPFQEPTRLRCAWGAHCWVTGCRPIFHRLTSAYLPCQKACHPESNRRVNLLQQTDGPPVRETQAERTRPLTPTTRRMRRTRNTGLAGDRRCLSAAVLTGLEPAIFALTTRRALQLLRKTKARSVLSEKCQRGAPSLSVCCSDPADLVVGHWLQLRRVVVRLVVHDGMSFLRVGPTRCEPAIFALTTPTAPQDQDDGP